MRRHLVPTLLKVAAFVMVTVVSTTLLALTIANSGLQSTDSYRARFTDVTAVHSGDDVRIGGVRVGQVEEIGLAPDGSAEVEFSLDEGRRIPADTRATVKFRNLVGQRYIALTPGPGKQAAPLPPGGLIPLEHTAPALNLTELFNGFKPLFAALDPADVNKLSYEIIRVLQGEGGTVRSLLAHTASLTTTLAEKDQVIGELVDNLNTVMGRIAARNDDLSALLVTLQRYVSGLAEDRKPIGEAVDAVADVTSTTAGFLREAREPLKRDIAGLRSLATLLDDNNETVERFLRRLPGKVAKITPTASYGSWFNFYLCQSSGKVTIPSLDIEQQVYPTPLAEQSPRCTR